MTDMLGVPAVQLGNPAALFVLSKTDDPALHGTIESSRPRDRGEDSPDLLHVLWHIKCTENGGVNR
jgi:hypothetical protein